MRIAFDEEVNQEDVEVFRKLSNKYRNPMSVLQSFAFNGQTISQPTQLHKNKEKNASLKLVHTYRKVVNIRRCFIFAIFVIC